MPGLALALASALSAAAGRPAPGAAPAIAAARTSAAPALDGHLDDPAWDRAVPFAAFVQLFPEEGGAPSERTEVRVLYDDARLYVGVRCFDREPERILRPLGRRDAPPYSDTVTLIIDADRDGRTAAAFSLNAAGVLQDGLFYDDDSYTADWDAVWDGRAAVDAEGWTAVFVLPLSILSSGNGAASAFGFGVKREVGRSHEVDATVLVPRNAKGVVSRLGTLVGLEGLEPARDLELSPYLAARLSTHPQYLDPLHPQPRLVDPSADLGVDLQYAPAPALVLNAALNPDFGQVEADQIIQNLTTYELYFPEKRPFFNQAKDLFQPVGAGLETSPQQLFYSRRIGLVTPILAAAKLTGRVSDTVQIALLDALVAGAGRPERAREDDPDGAVGFRAEEPLHLGATRSLPLAAPLTQNYLAGVLRWAPSGTVSLGASLTWARPFGEACRPDGEAALDTVPAGLGEPVLPQRCDVRSGGAGALDWNLKTRDGEWSFYGQADASVSRGGPPDRVLADGTHLRRGDVGFGAYATAGKRGGEPWRFTLHYEYESPRLDLNASGYQRTQNEQMAKAQLVYTRPSGNGVLHSWALYLTGLARFTTDGRGLNRGNTVMFSGEGQLKNFTAFGCDTAWDDPRWDVREIDQAGVAYLRAPTVLLQCWATTDLSKPLAFDGWAFAVRSLGQGPLAPAWRVGTTSTAIWRPHPRFEQRLTLQLERNAYSARWFDPGNVAGLYSFGDLVAPVLSATFRTQLVLTPRLTLQGYAQLFADYGHYRGFRWAAAPEGRVHPEDLQPWSPSPSTPVQAPFGPNSPDFHHTSLNVNLVLRWEYRLGSTLFLVYSRTQSELPWSYEGTVEPAGFARLWPRALGAGPAVDTLLVKWAYWWAL